MAPRKQPILENKTARIILAELDLYAKDRQFYPLEGALFTYLTKGEYDHRKRKYIEPRYPEMANHWGSFHYWFVRLSNEGFIEIDNNTRAVRCVHLQIVEKDASPLT